MAIDEGSVRAEDVALVGARRLDPPEEAFMQEAGIDDDVPRALDGTGRVYVALDCDVLQPELMACFMPEPGGLTFEEVEGVLRDVAARRPVVGMGLTGLRPEADAVTLMRFAAALGL
jgi:arginase family enzyme